MALSRHDNLHSWLVGWLRILLPLTALAILSTLFLFARDIDPADAIPYAEVDIEERLREPRMTDASYAGVTSDGASIMLNVATATPLGDGDARAQDLQAVLATPDGGTSTIIADDMALDRDAGVIRMNGQVRIATSTGYAIQTRQLELALDRTRLDAPDGIEAQGPGGQITADRLSLTSAEGNKGLYQVVFQGNVTLIYRPGQ
jgi:lipopolysaccharide export system protein LptC